MTRLRAARGEDAGDLAALHAAAFASPWSRADLADLLASPGAFALLAEGEGFILCRAIAGEAEILTLAVAPAARRRGTGRALVEAAAGVAGTLGAETLFLEVAHDNAAALALYDAAGFSRVGLRRGYYASGADAVVMRRALNT
jgi:ribosomal-protein-alanine N-acetyltransferase